jgi:choline dehydrogenase
VKRYDVIVVGAGAAGAPLAARLSEDPARQVLLLEAGPDYPTTDQFPAELLDATMLSAAMPGHPNNWSFLANLTPELHYTVARGKVLGGSTALNGTYFVRARKADFDRWVDMGNTEWSYEKALPYYRKSERDLTYGETTLHGGSGPIPVYRELGNPHPVTAAFAEASAELGFAGEADKNDQCRPGYGPLPVNALDGVRVNTGMAYVNPNRQRKNLTVRGDTVVRRILFHGSRATGVAVEQGGTIERIEAEQVVLSAGAIKSPHLLGLSGIGPRKDLEGAGIKVVYDLPGVGKGFTDHPDIPFTWKPRRRLDTADQRNVFESVLNFTAAGSDFDGDIEILPTLRPLSATLGIGVAGMHGVAHVLGRPIKTIRALKGVSLRRVLQQAAHRNNLSFAVALQQAESRGDITVTSADPSVAPRIDYNYLSTDSDLRRMRQAVRTTVAILRTRAFTPLFAAMGEVDNHTIDDDRALNAWMRAHLGTAIHACGTCKMGADPNEGAVVDQYGRVHGVTGLRVADTSILPFAPSRGPAATGVLIGERMADFIRAQS